MLYILCDKIFSFILKTRALLVLKYYIFLLNVPQLLMFRLTAQKRLSSVQGTCIKIIVPVAKSERHKVVFVCQLLF